MSDRPGAPRGLEAELAAAQEAQAKGDPLRAKLILERALQSEPTDQRARNLLGLTLFKLGDLERAEAIYRGLIDDHPADPTLRVNLGLVFLKRAASADAIHSFSTALDLQPEHAKAQNYLGLAYAQKGENALARDWFVKAGNAQMAERMNGLLAVPAPPPASIPPPRETAPADAGSTSQFSAPPRLKNEAPPEEAPRLAVPRAVRPAAGDSLRAEVLEARLASAARESSDTGEFARLPPQEAEGGDPGDTSEFSRAPITRTWPSHPPVPRAAPKTAPSLPPWPPPPSGSSIEGASEAMQRAFELAQAPRDKLSDTDPGSPPAMPPAAASEAEAQDSPGEAQAAPDEAIAAKHAVTAPGGPPEMQEAPVAPREETAESPASTTGLATSAIAAASAGSQLPAPSPAPAAAPPASSPSAVPPASSPSAAPPAVPASSSPPSQPPAPISIPPAWSQTSSGVPRLPQAIEPSPLAAYTSQWRLEVPEAQSSFAIGPSELVIHVRGEMLTRLDGLMASWGTASARSELKRFRGKSTDKPFGDGPRRMLRVSGEGRYVIARDKRCFTPIELGDEPAYFREEVLFAFEESLVFENGRVPSKLGGDLHLVHLRGRGRLLLVSAGEPRAVEVRKGEPLRIPMEQLVGWHGPLIQPRVVPIVDEAPELGIALELSGEGRALVDTP